MTVPMPDPKYLVRTDWDCDQCGMVIYSGEEVVRVRRGRNIRYVHIGCVFTRVDHDDITKLPPNRDWVGWTDYDRWRREYADMIDARLDSQA